MFVQQKLAPPTGTDPMQAKMMLYMMPTMITSFMLFLPAGLCLYMFTNSALSILQQRFIEARLKANVSATRRPLPFLLCSSRNARADGNADNALRRKPGRKINRPTEVAPWQKVGNPPSWMERSSSIQSSDLDDDVHASRARPRDDQHDLGHSITIHVKTAKPISPPRCSTRS